MTAPNASTSTMPGTSRVVTATVRVEKPSGPVRPQCVATGSGNSSRHDQAIHAAAHTTPRPTTVTQAAVRRDVGVVRVKVMFAACHTRELNGPPERPTHTKRPADRAPGQRGHRSE